MSDKGDGPGGNIFEKGLEELEAPPKNDEEKEVENFWLTLVNYRHQPFWHLSFRGTGWPGAIFKVFCGDVGKVLKGGSVHEKMLPNKYMCMECVRKYREARGLEYNVAIPDVPEEEKPANNIFKFSKREKDVEETEKPDARSNPRKV